MGKEGKRGFWRLRLRGNEAERLTYGQSVATVDVEVDDFVFRKGRGWAIDLYFCELGCLDSPAPQQFFATRQVPPKP
jgi:hypothetical protein